MNDSDAENKIEFWQMIPDIGFGDVCFDKMGVGMQADCFFQ